jgi:hypothetical protein
VNPAFVIRDWGRGPVEIEIDGEAAVPGKDDRFGYDRRAGGSDPALWFKMQSKEPMRIKINRM